MRTRRAPKGGATQTPIAAQARRVFVASKMTVIDAGAPALCSLNYVEYLEALARVAHADVCQVRRCSFGQTAGYSPRA